MYVLCVIPLSCPTLCDLCTVACQAPLFMRILQVRILEWVSTLFSKGSSQPRERTHVSTIAGRFFRIRKPMNTRVGSLSLLQGSSQPRERTHVSTIAGRFFKIRKPMNTGVGSLSLLQGIFPTQESNQGFLHWRQILYQLSYQGSQLLYKIIILKIIYMIYNIYVCVCVYVCMYKLSCWLSGKRISPANAGDTGIQSLRGWEDLLKK